MKYATRVDTIEKAMSAEAPSVGAITREKGKKFTESFIMAWLVYLNTMLNLKKPLSDEQIELCASCIVEEFYAIKISDLTLLFKKIISGQYGEFYESISPAKVLTFFRDYFNERCDIAEQSSIRSHQDINSIDTFNFTSNIERIISTGSKGFNKK